MLTWDNKIINFCRVLHEKFDASVMINSVPVCVSTDHDSEGKRVQDMLSTIEKPQVGMHTFYITTHTQTHTNHNHQSSSVGSSHSWLDDIFTLSL